MLDRFIKELDAGSKSGMIKKRIINYLLVNGNSSIPDIAKDLGFSTPTITKYVMEMFEDGYLSDYGKMETKEGRHPNTYGVKADSCYFVGVDIKWFSLTIGLVNFAGEMLEIKANDKFRFENTPAVLNDVCAQTVAFIDKLKIDKDKILNVNVNVSGRVNPDSGFSFSIFNFEERPLASVLSEKIGRNASVENDTRSMTYGEYIKYYADTHTNAIFVNVSWGVGIGLVIDGKIYSGSSGYAGEFGHMSVFNNEIMCHCGKKGCLETEASGSAIVRQLTQRIREGESSVLSNKVLESKILGLPDLLVAVEKEDLLTIELIEEVGQKLGKQIANMINLLNPDTVIVGGSLIVAGDYLMQPIKTAIRKYSLNLVSKDTQVVASKLKEKAGVVGACMIARYKFFDELNIL